MALYPALYGRIEPRRPACAPVPRAVRRSTELRLVRSGPRPTLILVVDRKEQP